MSTSNSSLLSTISPSPLSPSPPPPSTPPTGRPGPIRRHKAYDMDRDTRARVLTLFHDAGWDRGRIAKHIGLSYGQVKYTIQIGYPTPQKRSGRATILTEDQVDEIEHFVCQSRECRQMPYMKLATGRFAHFGVSWYTIRNVLKKR